MANKKTKPKFLGTLLFIYDDLRELSKEEIREHFNNTLIVAVESKEITIQVGWIVRIDCLGYEIEYIIEELHCIHGLIEGDHFYETKIIFLINDGTGDRTSVNQYARDYRYDEFTI